jgi:hypothetical protein
MAGSWALGTTWAKGLGVTETTSSSRRSSNSAGGDNAVVSPWLEQPWPTPSVETYHEDQLGRWEERQEASPTSFRAQPKTSPKQKAVPLRAFPVDSSPADSEGAAMPLRAFPVDGSPAGSEGAGETLEQLRAQLAMRDRCILCLLATDVPSTRRSDSARTRCRDTAFAALQSGLPPSRTLAAWEMVVETLAAGELDVARAMLGGEATDETSSDQPAVLEGGAAHRSMDTPSARGPAGWEPLPSSRPLNFPAEMPWLHPSSATLLQDRAHDAAPKGHRWAGASEQLTLDQFCNLLGGRGDTKEQLVARFAQCDVDGSGTVERSELVRFSIVDALSRQRERVLDLLVRCARTARASFDAPLSRCTRHAYTCIGLPNTTRCACAATGALVAGDTDGNKSVSRSEFRRAVRAMQIDFCSIMDIDAAFASLVRGRASTAPLVGRCTFSEPVCGWLRSLRYYVMLPQRQACGARVVDRALCARMVRRTRTARARSTLAS